MQYATSRCARLMLTSTLRFPGPLSFDTEVDLIHIILGWAQKRISMNAALY